jgi:protein-S-isoprenylcysteine O-methyltransferase Ste14
MKNETANQSNNDAETREKIVKRITQVVIQQLILMALLFASAGDLGWVWAWAYFGVGLGILAVNAFVLPREVIVERGEAHKKNVKGWDKVVSGFTGIAALSIPIVAGLDERWGWSPELGLAVHLAGLLFIALGQGLFTWAMTANRFFSTMVRIQEERGHAVASSGPYRCVRHPGYVGYIVASFATALALGSLWALVPAGLGMCGFVVRTSLEDKTLQEELAGYKEYAARVRYRLLPGVW